MAYYPQNKRVFAVFKVKSNVNELLIGFSQLPIRFLLCWYMNPNRVY